MWQRQVSDSGYCGNTMVFFKLQYIYSGIEIYPYKKVLWHGIRWRYVSLSPTVVPCIPQNVTAVETCSSDSASLTWNYANGAILYMGMATHVNGTVHTCAAMGPECTFSDLRCGESYDVYVMSTNLQCNSSESQRVTLQTGRCTENQKEWMKGARYFKSKTHKVGWIEIARYLKWSLSGLFIK